MNIFWDFFCQLTVAYKWMWPSASKRYQTEGWGFMWADVIFEQSLTMCVVFITPRQQPFLGNMNTFCFLQINSLKKIKINCTFLISISSKLTLKQLRTVNKTFWWFSSIFYIYIPDVFSKAMLAICPWLAYIWLQ